MKFDVVTIGDASEDIFLRPQNLKTELSRASKSGRRAFFELGEKIPVKEVDYAIGGSACNTAVGFSRLGLSCGTIVALGKDFPSEKILMKLHDENVDTKAIIRKQNIQTHFSVVMNVGCERTIFVYRGLRDYSMLVPKKNINPKWFYLGPMGENANTVFLKVIEKASEKGVKVAWNPGSIQIEKGISQYRNLSRILDLMILNREEALRFLSLPTSSDIKNLLKKIWQFGPKIVVITKGKDGAECFDGNKYYRIDAFVKNNISDVTGAGDSFSCGFMARLIAENKSSVNRDVIEEALKWGIFNSSSVIEKIGAQTGLLTRDEILMRVREYPRFTIEIY